MSQSDFPTRSNQNSKHSYSRLTNTSLSPDFSSRTTSIGGETDTTSLSGGSHPIRLRPVKSPGGNEYAYGNFVALSPLDFRKAPGNTPLYVMINGSYVVTCLLTPACDVGCIGLTDPQRSWMRVSIGPNDFVSTEVYDFKKFGAPIVVNAELEIGFALRQRQSSDAYDQDELGSLITQNFHDQFIASQQQLLLNLKNIPLRVTVKSLQLVNFERDGQVTENQVSEPLNHIHARGLITKDSHFVFIKEPNSSINLKASRNRPATNAILDLSSVNFNTLAVGGLDKQLGLIFRRAFVSRCLPASVLEDLDIQHVKGIMLYGPPGTGKTLIARELARVLRARSTKIVNGPEVLSKWVGQSEQNIRELFSDAEKEYQEKGDESGTHVIIFDEIDTICKSRGSSGSGGTGVNDNIVNQLLTKLDGVDQLNNILVIGMTNRLDLIDPAILRPGRFELHVEISLPDEKGRAQILDIILSKPRERGKLSPNVNVEELAKVTRNFTGAELAAFYKAASSYAQQRVVPGFDAAAIATAKSASPTAQPTPGETCMDVVVTMDDFSRALDDVKPMHGADLQSLQSCIAYGIVEYSEVVTRIIEAGQRLVNSEPDEMLNGVTVNMLLHGNAGCGTTALACHIALMSGCPFIQLITPAQLAGKSQIEVINILRQAFDSAYKSESAVLVIDQIEDMIRALDFGQRLHADTLFMCKALFRANPPEKRRLAIIATTQSISTLRDVKFLSTFQNIFCVPPIESADSLTRVIEATGVKHLDPNAAWDAATGNPYHDSEQFNPSPTDSSWKSNIGIKEVFVGIGSALREDTPQKQNIAFIDYFRDLAFRSSLALT